MPLLPEEPFIYPEGLLGHDSPLGVEGDQWSVLHTRPRAEKTLARRLHRAEIGYFLPVHKHRWVNQRRTFCSFLPLFPSYLFLHGSRDACTRAQETNLVVRVLQVEDQEQLQADLARVFCLMASGAPLTPETRLQPGTIVDITSGPLAGLEGKVIRHGKQLRLHVEVRFLQQGVSVEIESWMIEARRASPVRQAAGS